MNMAPTSPVPELSLQVQVAHLHNAARALSSPSRCFQLSTNLGKVFFRYLWYCEKKANRMWFSVALVKFHWFGINWHVLINLNAEIVACKLSFRKLRQKPNLENTSKYGFSPDLGGKNGGVLSMRMQVILDSSFARPGSAPIWGGKKGEFRDWTRRQRGPDCGCQRAWTVARFVSAGLTEQVEGWRRASEPRTRGRRSTMTALSRTNSHKELWSNCAYNYGTDGGRSRRRRSIVLLRLNSIAWRRAWWKSERKSSDKND